ncbi:hypothetical protein Pcinc_018811 [Petrolisthes cinctipes]|uniref:Uncharacterized protein n=1 Tax=Petrolisthes cinctipes TaxID=88211 RepID=A0AAE1KL80_PETCI|nr:hypothetical protein Pcinc_018811 [Petrolisthes cinctipes]
MANIWINTVGGHHMTPLWISTIWLSVGPLDTTTGLTGHHLVPWTSFDFLDWTTTWLLAVSWPPEHWDDWRQKLAEPSSYGLDNFPPIYPPLLPFLTSTTIHLDSHPLPNPSFHH